jgi:hypothetical protein
MMRKTVQKSAFWLQSSSFHPKSRESLWEEQEMSQFSPPKMWCEEETRFHKFTVRSQEILEVGGATTARNRLQYQEIFFSYWDLYWHLFFSPTKKSSHRCVWHQYEKKNFWSYCIEKITSSVEVPGPNGTLYWLVCTCALSTVELGLWTEVTEFSESENSQASDRIRSDSEVWYRLTGRCNHSPNPYHIEQ